MNARNNNLKLKRISCFTFTCVACGLGIVVPLISIIGISLTCEDISMVPKAPKELLSLCLYIIFLVSIAIGAPYSASRLYNKPKNEFIADFILYTCCFITIIMIALIIQYTGGIKDSLMSLSFFFLPSAVAIAFRGKIGLGITIVTCFIAVCMLHLTFTPIIHISTEHEVYKKCCMGFNLYQLCLIGVLEFMNAYLNKQGRNKKKKTEKSK